MKVVTAGWCLLYLCRAIKTCYHKLSWSWI